MRGRRGVEEADLKDRVLSRDPPGVEPRGLEDVGHVERRVVTVANPAKLLTRTCGIRVENTSQSIPNIKLFLFIKILCNELSNSHLEPGDSPELCHNRGPGRGPGRDL